MASRHLAQKWSGFCPQGDLEVLDRVGQSIALVLLLAAQEVIEGGLGADALGQRRVPEPLRPYRSSAPGNDAFLRW